jgi:ribosomal subunit interface protein
MLLPLQITFRNLERSDAIENKIRDRTGELEVCFDRITSCRVIIEALHKHHRHGNQFHVRVDLAVPDHEIVASHGADEHHAYTDVYVAIRDAFDNVERQLEDYAERVRPNVHTSAPRRHPIA